jgi:hypothetical protein
MLCSVVWWSKERWPGSGYEYLFQLEELALFLRAWTLDSSLVLCRHFFQSLIVVPSNE